MFSKRMNSAIGDAQKVINNCNSSQNVAMLISKDVEHLSELIKELDTSDIDFEKRNFFNNIKINKYWDNFITYYPSLKAVSEKFEKHKIVVKNTIKTLSYAFNIYETEYNLFQQEDDSSDEHFQQMMVAKNMFELLNNTLLEYKTLLNKVEMIINTTTTSLDIAVYLAINKYQKSISVSKPLSTGTIEEYNSEIQKLKTITNS